MISVTIKCGNHNGDGWSSYYVETDDFTVASRVALERFNATPNNLDLEVYQVTCMKGHGVILRVPEGKTEVTK